MEQRRHRRFAKGYKNSPETLFISGAINRGYAGMVANYHRDYPTRAAMGTLAFSELEVHALDEKFAVCLGVYHLDRSKKGGWAGTGDLFAGARKDGAGMANRSGPHDLSDWRETYAVSMNPSCCLKRPLTRRGFVSGASLAIAAAGVRGPLSFAQAAAPAPASADRRLEGIASGANAKIATQALRRNVSALMGSGGNIAVLPGPLSGPGADGKLLVDSGFSTSRPQLLAALGAFGPDPIGVVINTHWHYDHVDGNEWMHGTGATLFAHEKTRERMSTQETIAAFHLTVPPSPTGALPTELLDNTRTLHGNGATLMLTHYEPAHTDTDISIRFVEADVLHVGDTWFNGLYPFIDYSTGGSIDGMIRATEHNLRETTSSTIIIPGHGPIGTRMQLAATHDMLVAVRETVAKSKKSGHSEEEVVASKPTAAFDSGFHGITGTPDFFVQLVYQGV